MGEGTRSDAVKQLAHDHYEVVYRFAYRLSGNAADAEDLTQQTFVTACRKSDQVRSPDRSRSWLLAIVRNLYLKRFRKEQPVDFPEGYEPIDLKSDQIPELIDQEQLQGALNSLPEAYRTPVLLFYFEDLSYQEIAELLEVPMGTVMSRLSRGKNFLRERLAGTESTAGLSSRTSEP